MRDKLASSEIPADPMIIRRRPLSAGKQRAKAPAGDPEYGQRHAVKDNGVGPDIPASAQNSDCAKQTHKLGETGKAFVMGVGKSEWLGSDDRQDNITCLERGAMLRPRLMSREGSMSAARL